mmetsp:Transcript_64944/g.120892  ORF Transcript_64944/g.120892 Transcript_64944/m.120892 type:complete len:406 (+) Transcript_64944:67-1284(+)
MACSAGDMEFREVSPRSRARLEHSPQSSQLRPARGERTKPSAIGSPVHSPVFSGSFVPFNDGEDFEVISPKRSPQELPWLEEEDGNRGRAEVLEVLMDSLQEPASNMATQAAAHALRQVLAPGHDAQSSSSHQRQHSRRPETQGSPPRADLSRSNSADATTVEPPESAIIALLGEVLRENAALTVAVEGIMRRMVSLEQSVHGMSNGSKGCNGARDDAVAALSCNRARDEPLIAPPASASPPQPVAVPLPFETDRPRPGTHALSERLCETAVQCTNTHWAQDFAVLSGILGEGGFEHQEGLLSGLSTEELALLEVKLQDVIRVLRGHRERRSPRRRGTSPHGVKGRVQASPAPQDLRASQPAQGTAPSMPPQAMGVSPVTTNPGSPSSYEGSETRNHAHVAEGNV